MPRTARIAPGGVIYHCLDRGCARASLFDKAEDFDAFERMLEYALQCVPIRILSYCLMPEKGDGKVSIGSRPLILAQWERAHPGIKYGSPEATVWRSNEFGGQQ